MYSIAKVLVEHHDGDLAAAGHTAARLHLAPATGTLERAAQAESFRGVFPVPFKAGQVSLWESACRGRCNTFAVAAASPGHDAPGHSAATAKLVREALPSDAAASVSEARAVALCGAWREAHAGMVRDAHVASARVDAVVFEATFGGTERAAEAAARGAAASFASLAIGGELAMSRLASNWLAKPGSAALLTVAKEKAQRAADGAHLAMCGGNVEAATVAAVRLEDRAAAGVAPLAIRGNAQAALIGAWARSERGRREITAFRAERLWRRAAVLLAGVDGCSDDAERVTGCYAECALDPTLLRNPREAREAHLAKLEKMVSMVYA